MESLNNLFYLMVGLTLLSFIWIYLTIKTLTPNIIFSVPVYRPYLHGIFLLGAVACAIFAFVQYRRHLNEQKAAETAMHPVSIMEKVRTFRAASLRKYILLTLGTVLIILGFYLSAEPNYAAAYSILLIIFSINRPTPDRLVKDMDIKKEDQEILFKALREYRMEQENN